jgi:hypothetical protein
MKKQNLSLCGLLLAVALPLGCGGDDLFGTKCPSSGAALTSGVVTYTTVASQVADTCNNPPLAPSELSGDYTITTESSCGVTLKGPAGGTFGTGTATSGSFQAMYTAVVSESALSPPGPCQYRRTINNNVTITDDKSVTVQYSEIDDNWMSLPGQNCPPPAGGSCATAYTLTMTKK